MRNTLLTMLLAVVLSTSIGFAFGQASDPAPATAKPQAQAAFSFNQLYSRTVEIKRNTGPSGTLDKRLASILVELQQICRNTLPEGRFTGC